MDGSNGYASRGRKIRAGGVHRGGISRVMRGVAVFLTTICLMSSCLTERQRPSLVPSTVAENPALPSLEIRVAGRGRKVHYRTFGSKDNPPLLVIHGSLSDMRAYLPFKAFSANYFVVMWDMRGNGLSERVEAGELKIDYMVEEIEAIRRIFAPREKITLIGHSWSAIFVARYLATRPEVVEQAVLIEPFGLNDEAMKEIGSSLNLLSSQYIDLTLTARFFVPANQEELDFMMAAMLRSSVRKHFCDNENPPPWPFWRVGGLALLVWERSLLKGIRLDFDFAEGLEEYGGEVLLVGSSCSPVGSEFQKRYNEPFFRNARVLTIPDSGHRIITEQWETLETGLRSFLKEYHR